MKEKTLEKEISDIQEELESELNWDEDGSETGCFQIAGRFWMLVSIYLREKGKSKSDLDD